MPKKAMETVSKAAYSPWINLSISLPEMAILYIFRLSRSLLYFPMQKVRIRTDPSVYAGSSGFTCSWRLAGDSERSRFVSNHYLMWAGN
jgi:hypothetical protein